MKKTNMDKTTIQISSETLERLKVLKSFERQSYDEVLNLIIDEFVDEEPLTEKEIEEIKVGLEDIRMGRTTPIEQVAKELGITLK
jgi:predicted transcriptional regulator